MERLENTTNMSREATTSRENDEIAKKARKAEQKAKKDAAKASQRALAELTNKARCVEFERATRTQQTSLNNLTIAEPPPSRHRTYEILKGAYVFVEPDLSPGVCSHGGLGFVTGVDKTAGATLFTVEYDASSNNGRTETNVRYSRLTEKPYTITLVTARPARSSKAPNQGTTSENSAPQALPENLPLPELLSAAYCRRRKDGWRARDFGFDLTSRNCSRTDRFKSLVLQDYQALKVYLSNCDRSDPDAASRHSMK